MELKDLLSEKQYAAMRGVTIRTIQRERALRVGPPFIKLGRQVYYRPAAIDAWVMAQERAPETGKAA